MASAVSAGQPNALQKWGSLVTAVLSSAMAVIGHFGGDPFVVVMRYVLIASVAGLIALRYWRRS